MNPKQVIQKEKLKAAKLQLAETLSNTPIIDLTETEEKLLTLLFCDEQLEEWANEIKK